MSNTAWLVVALGIVALAIGLYIASLNVRKRRVERALNGDTGGREQTS